MKAILHHIAKKNVAKWVTKDMANALWAYLKSEGWAAEGLTMIKMYNESCHHFVFEKHGAKVSVSHRVMEVAS